MTSKPEHLLRPLIVNDKGRWFSQYDLKCFKELNGENPNFNLLPLAKMTDSVKRIRMVIFIDDGDYLVRGLIAAITEKGKLVCRFDDDTVATYSNNTRKLQAFCNSARQGIALPELRVNRERLDNFFTDYSGNGQVVGGSFGMADSCKCTLSPRA